MVIKNGSCAATWQTRKHMSLPGAAFNIPSVSSLALIPVNETRTCLITEVQGEIIPSLLGILNFSFFKQGYRAESRFYNNQN